MQVFAIVFQSRSSQFEEYESSHVIHSGQVEQTQQGYTKYGPVAFTWLINEIKTHLCAFSTLTTSSFGV